MEKARKHQQQSRITETETAETTSVQKSKQRTKSHVLKSAKNLESGGERSIVFIKFYDGDVLLQMSLNVNCRHGMLLFSSIGVSLHRLLGHAHYAVLLYTVAPVCQFHRLRTLRLIDG